MRVYTWQINLNSVPLNFSLTYNEQMIVNSVTHSIFSDSSQYLQVTDTKTDEFQILTSELCLTDVPIDL